VLVIGGGLAGLSATRSLRHRGHRVRLFEASDRLGGRVWTLRGFLAGGQVSEHGGEFISTEHSAMRGLADKFGPGLENTLRYPAGTRDRYVFGGGPAEPVLVRRFLRQLQPVLPGGAAHWNGRAWLDHWAAHPWTHGSYAYRGPGHYTRFAGYEGVPEGTIHFAGEHTSLNFQGYMEGAVRSGRRAAREIG
jgi:monoamine oxidase